MLRNVWSKTLWDYRSAILGWGIGLGLYLFIDFNFFVSLSPAARQQEIQLARSSPFLGDPVAINTAAGFATWNGVGLMPVLLGIWVLLAGANLLRRSEKDGSMDLLLAAVARQRMFLARLAALISALFLIALFLMLGAILGETASHTPVDVVRALLMGLNVCLTALLFGVIALFLAQFFKSPGVAAGITGALMVFCYALDGLGRSQKNGAALQRFSPFYYFDQNKPLITTYSSHTGAAALLLGICLVLFLVSFLLFIRRDIGEAILGRPRSISARTTAKTPAKSVQREQRNLFLRATGLQELRTRAKTIFWWMVGLGAYTLLMTAVAQSTESSFQQFYAHTPSLAKIFAGQDIGTNAGFIQTTVFFYVPVVAIFFALVLANSWPDDLEKGRLEVVMSTPQPRWRILLERFLALMVGTFLVALAIGLCLLLGTDLAGLSIDAGRVMTAAVSIWPMELLAASLVFLLTKLVRAGAIFGLVGAFVAISFFANLLNPLLNLPSWVLNFSLFYQYGSPLLHGMQWEPVVGMVALALIFVLIATGLFMRSDLERGS